MSDNEFAIPIKSTPAELPFGMEIPSPSSGCDVASAAAFAKRRKSMELLKWVFSFPALLGTFLIGRVFYEGRNFFVDPDLWWHIKNGQNILATHHWPTTDPYSSTVFGQPWIDCEWVGDVLLAAVARIGGGLGLDILLISLASIIMLAIYYYGTLRSGNCKAGFVAALILCSLAFASFTLRPQMLGYLYLIALLVFLEQFRRGKPYLLLMLPPLFLLWINSHGSWIIGLGAFFVTLASGFWTFRLGGVEAVKWTNKERMQLELALLGSLAMLPLTPYGTEPIAYPFEVALKLPIGVANVMEWQSMPFHLVGGKMFLALLLGFIVVQAFFRYVWRLDELALFVFGTMMACLHVRFLLVFVPFFAPILATVFARWLPPYDRKKEHYVLNSALMAAVAVCLVWYFPTRAQIGSRISARFPTGTTKYLLDHPVSGRLFNSYGFGGYLIGAGQRVFVDGRSDPYERGGALSDYFHITYLKPGAFIVLNRYGISACLLETSEPLATVLANSRDWRRLASDEVSVLYVRREHAVGENALPLMAAEKGKE